ncbi:hypothetical protein [Vreelandella alkaliphila]|uniref:Uncharacterized protein n=1 Tax=Vreelandella alkaliphila TaxID=272774 RepID=A0AAJ2RZS0_9GAMM|nr:hypothetical protein [Halomonas alkaliphila]MDX5979549.1 hypothetical protein [Halomonas alkaliphila]
MSEAINWQSAKIMPRFYDGIARSMIGEGPCRKIAKFKMGYGFLDTSQTPPMILDVPDDLEDIPNVFFEGVPHLQYGDGRILARCHMPDGHITEPHQYSLTALYDDADNLVAVSIDLPAWVVPSNRHTTFTYIDFPHVGNNAPVAFGG